MINTEGMSLGGLALAAAAKYCKKLAFETYRDGGVYDRFSYRDFGLLTRQFASLLISLGIRPGDRVMLLAENRPQWPAAYFGAALAGAVVAPVLTGFTPEQIRAIADHAGIAAFFTSELCAEKIDPETAPGVPRIFIDSADSIGEGGIVVSLYDREKRLPLRKPPSSGKMSSATMENFPMVRETDCAAIIYTSGTTGDSKAVMLSHRNLLFTAQASRSLMKIFSRDRLLSVIPLAHTYECTLGLLTAVISGAAVNYLDRPPSPAVLFPAVQNLRPTAMVTVPLFIEKICRRQLFPALEKNPLSRVPLTRFLAEALVGRKLGTVFGGALRFFGIGGAPLTGDVERFLRKIRFPYSPGYGLTETAPLVTGTAPYHFPFRSVGRPVKGVEIRIVPVEQGPPPAKEVSPAGEVFPVGEIQIRGPNVMLGYYRDEDRTREAFTADGWLKTGDLGCLDRRGFLYVRGRLKALILGPSGENIYPEEIESLILASDLVEETLVYAGERGELLAQVTRSEAARFLPAETLGEKLAEQMAAINRQLPQFSRLSRIEVRDEPFEKTPTGKIRRYRYTGGEPPC